MGCTFNSDANFWCTQTNTCEANPAVPFLCQQGIAACLTYTAKDLGVFEVTHNSTLLSSLPVVDWLPSTNGTLDFEFSPSTAKSITFSLTNNYDESAWIIIDPGANAEETLTYYTYEPTRTGSLQPFDFRAGVKTYIDQGATLDFYIAANLGGEEVAWLRIEYGGVANRDVIPESVVALVEGAATLGASAAALILIVN